MTRLRHLRYFVAVAEEGQMTRAAARLHLAQPALSQAIASLEAELGVRLLERHARGVEPTAAGEAFLRKARTALAAIADADEAADSLSRGATRALVVGFIGPPPLLKAPEVFAAFTREHPYVEVAFRELPFPRGSSASWLSAVDVAFCHRPEGDASIEIGAVRREPRVVLLPRRHRLARRDQLVVADVLEDTFISYHPAVQPRWAGFHSLDDHRGGPPAAMTGDLTLTPPEMLSSMSSRRAITTLPACDAAVIVRVLRGVVAVPLTDARPAQVALAWRRDNPNPHISALAAFAAGLADSRPDGAGEPALRASARGKARAQHEDDRAPADVTARV